MAEWLNAVLLKSTEPDEGSVRSNRTASSFLRMNRRIACGERIRDFLIVFVEVLIGLARFFGLFVHGLALFGRNARLFLLVHELYRTPCVPR